MNKILYFVCCRSSPPALCGTREEKRPTLFPLASMRTSRQVTQTLSNPPLADFCVPCVPSGTGNEDNRPKASSHKTTQAPDLLPGGPVCPVSTPGGGTTRPSPVRGRFWPHRGKFGRSHRRSREAGKPFSFFCFSQAGNKTHRSLKPTHSSLLGRASRAPARRCRSAQKAGRSPHPLCRKERSL